MNYSPLTLRYFRDAVGAGMLGPGACRGAAGSRKQGTWVQFDVELHDGVVHAARFLAFGCPHTIAVAAWVAEQAIGREARPVLREGVQELSERFGVPVDKRGRLLVIEDAWIAVMTAGLQR